MKTTAIESGKNILLKLYEEYDFDIFFSSIFLSSLNILFSISNLTDLYSSSSISFFLYSISKFLSCNLSSVNKG